MRFGSRRLFALAVACALIATGGANASEVPRGSEAAADDEPFELFIQARAAGETDDRLQAEQQWQRGLELFGSEPYARLEFARQLVRWGDTERAAEQFEIAVDLAPDNPDLLWAAGLFLRRNPDATDDALDRSERHLLHLVELQPAHDRAWVELGILALSRRDFGQAADWFRRARDIAPFNLAASGYLAEALMRDGNVEDAEKVLRALVTKDPQQLRARMALVRMYSDRGDADTAIELLRAVPPEQASDHGVNRRLAFLLADTNQIDDAVDLVSMLLAETPQDLDLRRLAVRLESSSGRYERAAELLETHLRASPEDIDAVLELAEYLEMQGRYDEAEAALERSRDAVRDGSDEHRRATLYLLDLLGRRGRWSAVLEETAPLVEDTASPDWTVFPLHAEAVFHVHGLRRAKRLLDRLAEGDPGLEPAVRAKEAELLLNAGAERRARAVLDELMTFDGPLGPSLAARVWSVQDRAAEAVAPAAEAVRRDPEDTALRFQWAVTLAEAGHWPEAERELLRIMEFDPEHAPSLNYLGYTWADRGTNLERALELTSLAVELNPANGAYQDSLGWAYFQLERYQEARPHLERAAALIPNDAVILEHLGDLYRALGETDRARAFYRWAVRIGPGNPDLSGKLGDLSDDG